jgi:parallel beta-helix repeat protein
MVDGANHMIYSINGAVGNGIVMSGMSNVKLESILIRSFECGVLLDSCINSNITACDIENNYYGIMLNKSSNIDINRNVLRFSWSEGIELDDSSNNHIIANLITDSGNPYYALTGGLALWSGLHNSISNNTF